MATVNEKIRAIIAYYKLSDRQFAIRIGVTQSVISSMFQKGTEPSSKVIRNTLEAFPELSSDWFLRDTGEMLISNKPNTADADRINKLVDTIATLQEAINAKTDIIAAQQERIKQLEDQLKKQ